MSTALSTNNEAAILQRVLEPDRPTLSVAAARSILAIEFSPADKARMRELAAKARAGSLTADEQAEIDAYGRVGSLLAILKSKARRSLKRRARTNGSAR
jgi:hypothetical protein